MLDDAVYHLHRVRFMYQLDRYARGFHVLVLRYVLLCHIVACFRVTYRYHTWEVIRVCQCYMSLEIVVKRHETMVLEYQL